MGRGPSCAGSVGSMPGGLWVTNKGPVASVDWGVGSCVIRSSHAASHCQVTAAVLTNPPVADLPAVHPVMASPWGSWEAYWLLDCARTWSSATT